MCVHFAKPCSHHDQTRSCCSVSDEDCLDVQIAICPACNPSSVIQAVHIVGLYPTLTPCTCTGCFHSGLIQDHVVSGTLLAKRDTFFTRQEYSQLLFVGCTVWTSKAQGGTSQAAMQLDPPTILKPQPMWTGKQVRGKGPWLLPIVNLADGQHLRGIEVSTMRFQVWICPCRRRGTRHYSRLISHSTQGFDECRCWLALLTVQRLSERHLACERGS